MNWEKIWEKLRKLEGSEVFVGYQGRLNGDIIGVLHRPGVSGDMYIVKSGQKKVRFYEEEVVTIEGCFITLK